MRLFWTRFACIAAVFSCGCIEAPSQECDNYVDCFDAYVEAGGTDANPQEIAAFRSDGLCWNTPASAYDCTQLCIGQLEGLQRDYQSLEVGEPPATCTPPAP